MHQPAVKLTLERIDNGFWERFPSSTIEKILCSFDGYCRVYFLDGRRSEIQLECTVYNEQYGYPVSERHGLLFSTSWQHGVSAYDLFTGEIRWKVPGSRMTRAFPIGDYLIVMRYGYALLKLDIQAGALLSKISGGTLEHQFWLTGPYVFVECVRGKHVILNTDTMQIVRSYRPQEINPKQCLSFAILDAEITDNGLVISGFEEYPNGIFNVSPKIVDPKRFSYVIESPEALAEILKR